MAIRKDKIIVVDIEATCWEGYDAPEGQENEVIEIGLCLLDATDFSLSDKRSLLVKPTESVVSDFCTELTSLTQEQVDTQGIAFDEACSILEKEYDSRNRLWASWGNWDRMIMKKQCKRRKVRYPFSKKHVNLKRVFQDAHGERMGLARAMKALQLDVEGTMHRGDDDAWNTGRLLSELVHIHERTILRKYGF
ncbi:MAG: exonuclease domain-containing protein [Aggregatilineales bacterium]